MNSKHLALILVGFLAVMFVQGVLQSKKRLAKINKELAAAQSTARGVDLSLKNERSSLAQLQKNSATMLEFLNSWSEALRKIETPEAGELNIASRVKQGGLITLSQRFESISAKNDTIPQIIRAHLTFEGDYVKTLNWLGKVEADLPSSRVTNLRIVRGETGNDVRMSLVLDLPLVKKDILATP